MSTKNHRSIRHTAGILGAALLALPAAANAADYRPQLAESISSGAAGVSPSLTLAAQIDNGSGGAPVPTGSLRFTIAAGHPSPGAWTSLRAATPGTQLGTITSELTGTDASPLRVLGQGTDATGAFVRAGVERRAQNGCGDRLRHHPGHAPPRSRRRHQLHDGSARGRRKARCELAGLDAPGGHAGTAQRHRVRWQELRPDAESDQACGTDEHRSWRGRAASPRA